MCEPQLLSIDITDINEMLESIVTHVMHAKSALNMQPNPIKDVGEDAEFLSEKDAWVKHACEHLDVAAEQAIVALNEL